MIFNVLKDIKFSLFYKKLNILSLILIILSISVLLFKGLNLGVDFKGGTLIELRVDKDTPNHLYYYCSQHPGMGSNALILKNDLTNLHLVSGSSVSTGSFGKLIGDGSEITNITEEDPNAIAFALALGG